MNKKSLFILSLCIVIIFGAMILLISQGHRLTEEIVQEQQPEKVATVSLDPGTAS